jgi:hypothetical protein
VGLHDLGIEGWEFRHYNLLLLGGGSFCKCGNKDLTELLEGLRENRSIGKHRHEVVVSVPPWNHVPVKVIRDTGSSAATLIDANIESIGSELFLKDPLGEAGQFPHLPRDLLRDLIDFTLMDGRGDHEMPAAIGIPVHHNQGRIPLVYNQRVSANPFLNGTAEKTSFRFIVPYLVGNVANSPRRPQAFHRVSLPALNRVSP